jgi:hypothetical protein
VAAVGIPKLYPNISPRLVVRIGFAALVSGIAVLMVSLDAGAGPEVVTWPMLLAGFGIGALASQLGSVTVSAVPDEQSGEVGGLQNTLTNLGASIGTALAGAVLISTLSASFFSGIQNNPDIPAEVKSAAVVELAPAVPFVSDAQLKTALDDAGVAPATASAIVDENATARINGLRASLGVLAIVGLLGFALSRRIPTKQPGAPTSGEADPTDSGDAA